MMLNRLLAGLFVALCFTTAGQGATTLLPPPKQCFQNANGPLASGTVQTYVPGTNTLKSTWQDSSQTSANTNPITLDINGCAQIYGVGSYRFVVKDSAGNQLYDQLTTDTSSFNSVFWAGTAGGTPNVITLTYPGFTGTDGSVIQFLPISTNTGSVTINPSGFGAIPVVKDTTAGAVSLIGGEIVATGTPAIVSVVYSASQNNFHLLNTVIASASGATAPLCGATGLKITNGASPNTLISLTADQAVMQTTNGVVINRSNISLTSINITTGTSTSTANGMDGSSPGTAQWLYVYLIDNGAAPAGLVSLSATAPTMPSGYNYRCRLGAMRVDGSGNLLRTLQLGKRTQYTQATYFPVASGNSGGITLVSLNVYAPPTATVFHGELVYSGAATGTVTAGPSANNSFIVSLSSGVTTSSQSISFSLLLEAYSVAYNSNTTAGSLLVTGWEDKVSAN